MSLLTLFLSLLHRTQVATRFPAKITWHLTSAYMQWLYGRSAFERYVRTKFTFFHRLPIYLSDGAPPRALHASGSSANNGNFICVLKCTIVNLATHTQFTNAAWDWIIKKKRKKHTHKKRKQNKKRKELKLHLVWAIPIPISTTKDVICCSNGYIYHFLDYIKLLLFVNANVIHHVYEIIIIILIIIIIIT